MPDLEWTVGCLNCGQIGTVFSSDKIENIRCGQCHSSEFMVEKDPCGTVEWLTKFFEARLDRMKPPVVQ
jgi:hypothetical protein